MSRSLAKFSALYQSLYCLDAESICTYFLYAESAQFSMFLTLATSTFFQSFIASHCRIALTCNRQGLLLSLTLLQYKDRRHVKAFKHPIDVFSSFLITCHTSDVWSMLTFNKLHLHLAFKSGAEVGLDSGALLENLPSYFP